MSDTGTGLALAVMDDDGWGCAITSEPPGWTVTIELAWLQDRTAALSRVAALQTATGARTVRIRTAPADEDPARYAVVLRGHYHGAGCGGTLCACPSPRACVPAAGWNQHAEDTKEGS